MISHRNVIANILQKRTFESIPRKSQGVDTQVILGLLPFSHIYGLVLITHVSAFRGDEVIVQPRFELERCLAAIAQFKIQQLNLVPPILIQMLKNQEKCRKYDLSSVRFVYTGAAPLGRETAEDLMSIYPKWHIGQGYGEILNYVPDNQDTNPKVKVSPKRRQSSHRLASWTYL